MTESEVELIWSEVPGESVAYLVYRLDSADGLDLEAVPLTDDQLIYSGPDLGVVDATVGPDRFYTYLLEVRADGVNLGRRWTTALTVTDNEPPSAITGLTAEATGDGVRLSWDPSTDNVEFASYSVSLLVDGELRYLGGGADSSQTTFLDDRPEPGQNVYVVQAVDFHDNRTSGAQIKVSVD